MTPFQIIFTPTAAAELGTLPKELQLEILGEFRGLPHDIRSDEMDKFGRLNRDGHHMFRFRLGNYRVYFCLLYTSPSPRDGLLSRMPSSA